MSTTINMTKTCKANGIETFSRTRGGWMKLVEGYDTTKYGGYRFVGSNFVKVGNFETELNNGLYLDCSKPVINGEKTEIMNLFKIHNGEVELLNTTPKISKWANNFEEDVESYFNNENVNVDEIVEVVKDMTCNKSVLHEVGRELIKDSYSKVWLNETHFQAFMKEAYVYKDNHSLHKEEVATTAVELFHNNHKAMKFFNYTINNEYHVRNLYAVIQNNPHFKRHYSDFKVVVERISEDYYTNLDNIKQLRNYNNNFLSLTNGKALRDTAYYYSFNHGTFSDRKTIYIVIPNVVEETIKVQYFDMKL